MKIIRPFVTAVMLFACGSPLSAQPYNNCMPCQRNYQAPPIQQPSCQQSSCMPQQTPSCSSCPNVSSTTCTDTGCDTQASTCANDSSDTECAPAAEATTCNQLVFDRCVPECIGPCPPTCPPSCRPCAPVCGQACAIEACTIAGGLGVVALFAILGGLFSSDPAHFHVHAH